MASNHNNVIKVYKNVIDEVIRNVREAFLNDGVDEQVLQELKQIWESKVSQSRAVEVVPAPTNDPKPRVPVHVTYNAHPHQQVVAPRQQVVAPRQPVATTVAMATPAPQASQTPQYITAQQYLQQAYTTQILVPGPSGQPVQQLMSDNLKGNPPALRPAYHGMQVPTIQTPRTQQSLPLVHPHAVNTQTQQASTRPSVIIQLDGPNDSDSEDDDDDDDDFNEFGNGDNDGDEKPEEDSEPLNSEDDVSDEDSPDLFETDNVVVCQYDRITRSKNKWKFHLKDGIMNLNGKDYVFQKANGDAEW